MAEDKKGILVYADWIDKFEELEDDEAGRLIKHFFRYVNDLNPVAPDRTTKLMFIDLQNQLKRDLKKWENTVTDRSLNGRLGNLKRWNLDLYNKVIIEEMTIEEAENIAKHRKVSLPDKTVSLPIANVAVNDSVSVNDNVNDINTDDVEKKPSPSKIYSIKDFEKIEIGQNEFSLLASRRSGKNIEEIKILFTEFVEDQKGVNKIAWTNEVDAKKHFINWIAIKTKTNGTKKQQGSDNRSGYTPNTSKGFGKL